MKKLMLLLMMVLLVGTVSAFEFDNKLTYSNDDLKVDFDNLFGFGKYYGSAELKSHASVDSVKKVGVGKQIVMYYDFNFTELYTNGLGDIEFTDERTGKIIERDYQYVYWVEEEYEQDIYGETFFKNGTATHGKIGTETRIKGRWLSYDTLDIPKGEIRIGIEVDNQVGDYVDGVWKIVGKTVKKHASWQPSLETQILAWYGLNETTGTTAYDLTGNFSGLYEGNLPLAVDGITPAVTNFSQFFDGASAINVTGLVGAGDDYSFSFWTNASLTAGNDYMMDSSVGRILISMGNAGTSNNLGFYDGAWRDFGVPAPTDGEMRHYVMILDSGNSLGLLYINGTNVANVTYGSTNFSGNIRIGGNNAGSSEFITGKLDEFAIYQRLLSFAEITILYNNDNACTWKLCTILPSPTITLNSPIDNFNSTVQSITLNATVTDIGGIVNITWNIDGVVNATNSSGFNGTYILIQNYLDDTYNWSVLAYNSINKSTQSATRTFTVNTTPIINVFSPTNASFTNPTIFFNATSSLAIDTWIVNYNGTNTTLSAINTTLEVEDGSFNLSLYANNSVTGVFGLNNTIFFSVDATAPFLNLTAPSGLIDFGILTVNETLNWVVNDTNLDSCFYNYNSINTTVTCVDNTTTFALTSQRNLTFYANDTFGNLVSNFTIWSYKIFENNQTFTATVTEGSLETFSINYDVDPSMTVTIANLSYNDTQNIGSITNNGDGNFIATESLITPTVTIDANVTFFWNFTFSDGSFVNATSNNQTIQDLNISDCSVNSNLLLNLTLVNEETQDVLDVSTDNTSIEVDIDLSPFGSTTPIIEFSRLYNLTNPAEVCLNLPIPLTVRYRMDSTIKYQADPYSIEHYNIQNFTLENTTAGQEITLFDLLTADTTDFRITFKDSDFVPVENALIQINRQYVSEGTFKTVEIPKTDANGQAVAHLVAKDIIYNIIVIKEGVILGTFNNVVAFCDDIVTGACFINLNALRTNPSILDIDTELGLASSFDYNSTSRVLSYTFTVLDGSVKNVTLTALKLDQLGNTSACFETLISSSGVITCIVPPSIGNETIITTILVDGDPTITTFVRAGRDFDIGDAGFFILFFMVLTFALMFIESKSGVIIGVILGFITSALFGLIQGAIIGIGSAIVWLIISGAILIWKLNREGQS